MRRWGEDPGLFCASYCAWVNDWLENRDKALNQMEQSVSLACELENHYGQASTLALASHLCRLREEPQKVLEITDQAIHISEEPGYVQ